MAVVPRFRHDDDDDDDDDDDINLYTFVYTVKF